MEKDFMTSVIIREVIMKFVNALIILSIYLFYSFYITNISLDNWTNAEQLKFKTNLLIFLTVISVAFWICDWLVKRAKYKNSSMMYHALVSSIQNSPKDITNSELVNDLLALFKQLKANYNNIDIKKNAPHDSLYSSLNVLLQDIDMLDEYIFFNYVCRFDIDIYYYKKIARKNLKDLIDYVMLDEPYCLLSSKDSHLMMNLRTALKENNFALGMNNLQQLAEDMKCKTDEIIRINKEHKKANIISVAGILLTILFGFISLLLALR